MPIGQRSSVTRSKGMFLAGDAGAPLREFAAVAMTPAGLVECSATSNGSGFIGFAAASYGAGDPVYVVSLRGSTLEPLVEGDVDLSVGSPVFLSGVLGEVTQTPPSGAPNTFLVQVGVAASSSTLFLNTDFRVGMPS